MIILHIIATIFLVIFAGMYGFCMAAATQEGCTSIFRYIIPAAIAVFAVVQWWL
jgi:hypothetical protein